MESGRHTGFLADHAFELRGRGWVEKLKGAGEFAKKVVAREATFVPGVLLYAGEPDVATFGLSFATAYVGKIEEGAARLWKEH